MKNTDKKLKNTDNLKTIKKTTQELLKLLGIAKAKIKLEKDEGEVVYINIDCDNSGILIGSRGETISSLQLILSLIVHKKLDSWQRLVLNVGDYREKRAESLEKLASNIVQRVKFSGEEAIMPYLNSAERRVVHLALADSPDVVTESRGEGEERRLIIKPKSKEISLEKTENSKEI